MLAVCAIAVLVLAGCYARVEGSLLTVAPDGTVAVTIRCTHESEACTGDVLIRLGGIDSEAVAYSIPAAASDAVVVTLSGEQYALVPSDQYVPGEVVDDALTPADTAATATEVGLHRAGPFTARVSVANDGTPGDSNSFGGKLSNDGRFVVFDSEATNLETNAGPGVYVYDRRDGTTGMVSRALDGTAPAEGAGGGSIDGSGNAVAFASAAPNIVVDDDNGAFDVFVHDPRTGPTTLASVASDGTQANGDSGAEGVALSADSRFVAFWSAATNLVPGDTNGIRDLFVHDRSLGTTERATVSTTGTQADQLGIGPFPPALSADGRYVTFSSAATTLVADDTNAREDVFVRDVVGGTTTRVSLQTGGGQANSDSRQPAISADGRMIAFFSNATNLVGGDTNLVADVFVHDRQDGTTARVSINASGVQGNGSSLNAAISADGRFVSYSTSASNIPFSFAGAGVIRYDRASGTVVKVANGTMSSVSISGDGRHVGLSSSSPNIVPEDTNFISDVFVRDMTG